MSRVRSKKFGLNPALSTLKLGKGDFHSKLSAWWWKHDPFKGESSRPTRGSIGHFGSPRLFFCLKAFRSLWTTLLALPSENYHNNGKCTIWRSISYWTWTFFQCDVSFHPVLSCLFTSWQHLKEIESFRIRQKEFNITQDWSLYPKFMKKNERKKLKEAGKLEMN